MYLDFLILIFMKGNLMKNNSKNNYTEARTRWANEQSELFLNALEKAGIKMGINITPMQYVKAYKTCIETYKFGYPAEYKAAEIISTEESYEQILQIMEAIMKRFRREFYKTRKKKSPYKNLNRSKRAA